MENLQGQNSKGQSQGHKNTQRDSYKSVATSMTDGYIDFNFVRLFCRHYKT